MVPVILLGAPGAQVRLRATTLRRSPPLVVLVAVVVWLELVVQAVLAASPEGAAPREMRHTAVVEGVRLGVQKLGMML